MLTHKAIQKNAKELAFQRTTDGREEEERGITAVAVAQLSFKNATALNSLHNSIFSLIIGGCFFAGKEQPNRLSAETLCKFEGRFPVGSWC